ncbi:MAG TPA: LLM class flavin-dependent oxidoreductase [Actinomycetota bacterium]|nr:LLM class flavin-dependent oxidoreductase [Actinomycetota bacterium]
MKLGIALPNTLVPDVNRGMFLDWARAADQAGFHSFGTIDRPSQDVWDPLTALAAAAAVTERVRLATTILQLPNRNEVLVAKQAAIIDRLSGGRLDLGIGIGWDENDYKVLGARWQNRGKKFERQIRKIRRTWRAAKKATPTDAVIGPAPMQKPLPPIWIGGNKPRAIARAIEMGDGYMFGASGAERMVENAPQLRAQAEQAGKKKFLLGGLAYVAIGDDTDAALAAAGRSYRRYYGNVDDATLARSIHAGPVDVVAQAIKEYEPAGLDVLWLFPEIPDVKQVETIAEHILPSYRVPQH